MGYWRGGCHGSSLPSCVSLQVSLGTLFAQIPASVSQPERSPCQRTEASDAQNYKEPAENQIHGNKKINTRELKTPAMDAKNWSGF